MARYKVLKSVAHNVGHSFTSLMNYADDDYVMGHILRFARRSGTDTLVLDFVRGQAGPPELLQAPISEVPSYYVEKFWDLVQRHGSDRSLVQSATLTVKFNLAVERPNQRVPGLVHSPFTCEVRITDTRGKTYSELSGGWWAPENFESPISHRTLRFRLLSWIQRFFSI
jgi:hypothetical protein